MQISELTIKHSSTNIKQNEREGNICGYASVFNNLDSHGDIISHGSFAGNDFSKVKLLWQHNSSQPIGKITRIEEDNYGLYIEAELLLDISAAKEAYNLIKSGVISGLSIGFKPIKFHYDDDMNRIIEEIDLWEISLVTFPANKNAGISHVKQYEESLAPSKFSFLTSKGERYMQIADISNKVNKLGQAWEEFKSINDLKLKEIAKKGSADPLFDQQLNKINEEMDSQKSRLDNVELAMSRSIFNDAHSENNNEGEYKKAFTDYLRKGNDKGLNDIEAKSLSSLSDPEGGFLIRPKVASEMTKSINDISPFRELASVETISTDSLDIIEDGLLHNAGWIGEAEVRKDTDNTNFTKKKITVHEMYAQPKATQKLIDDSSVDIEKWLMEKLTQAFAKTENTSFINGDGIGKPRGILTYGDVTKEGVIEQLKTTNLTADDLIKLYFSLNEKYAVNGTFLMNRYTLQQIRTLKTNDNQYIWSPGLSVGVPDLLLGMNVKSASDMPVIGKNKIAIAFADFKSCYKIVDRTGIRVLRDPFTDKPFVKFYATKRVGGDVVNSAAIKLLKIE